MSNHPGRPKPGSAQEERPLRMTPQQLRDILARANLTPPQAAPLAGVAARTMQQYLAGERAMPLSASGLLCLSLIVLGGPAGLLAPWLLPAVADAAGALKWAAATAPSTKPRSRSVGRRGAAAGHLDVAPPIVANLVRRTVAARRAAIHHERVWLPANQTDPDARDARPEAEATVAAWEAEADALEAWLRGSETAK